MPFTPFLEIEQSDAEQLDLLRELLAIGSEKPRSKSISLVNERTWTASVDPSDSCDDHAFIVARHPSLSDRRFHSVPPYEKIKISRSVYRGRQGYFHSQKTRRTHHYRSRLEYLLMRICEVDFKITDFVEHPFRLTYMDAEGKRRVHVPDLFVSTLDGCVVYEVKWEADAASPANSMRWPLIGEALSRIGCTYEVLTEKEILRVPKLANVNSVLRARRQPKLDDRAFDAIKAKIGADGISLATLMTGDDAVSIKQVFRLVLDGYLEFDLNQELDESSIVRLTGGCDVSISI